MKKFNLIEGLQNIDDRTIERVLSIKIKEDLRREKLKEKKKSFKWLSIGAVCTFAIIGCVFAGGATFDMEKGTGDVSGLYDGVKESEKTIDAKNVTILTMEDVRYAIWTSGEYTYSYSSSNSDANFMSDLNDIISLT